MRLTNLFAQKVLVEQWAFEIDGTGNDVFTFKINAITNPDSVRSAGSWSVATYNVIGGNPYSVDGGSTSTSYTSTRGTLQSTGTGLDVSDRTTWSTNTQYTFYFIPSHKIPANG